MRYFLTVPGARDFDDVITFSAENNESALKTVCWLWDYIDVVDGDMGIADWKHLLDEQTDGDEEAPGMLFTEEGNAVWKRPEVRLRRVAAIE